MKKNNSSHSCFFVLCKSTLAALLLLPLFALQSNSQPFLKQYKPVQEYHTNSGHCIIKADATDAFKYVTVGQYRAGTAANPFGLQSGLVHWTNSGGPLMDWINIDEAAGADEGPRDHWLNFIDSNVVYGEKIVAGLPTAYHGYPATGWVAADDPNQARHQTWTTLIDPVNHNTQWNYYIVDQGGEPARETIGVGVVWDREYPNDFIVVSAVSYFPDINGIIGRTTLVTKYQWNVGLNGHQLAWSFEYFINDNVDNFTVPVGIVQGADNDIVIAGYASGPIYGNLPPYPFLGMTDSKIITIKIDNLTGNVVLPFRKYVNNNHGSFVPRSITGPYDANDLLISGFVRNNTSGYQKPLLMSIDQNLGVNPINNRSTIYDCGTSAFLNCAKRLDQADPPAQPPTKSTRIVAVGSVASGNSNDAFILNTNRLDGVGANRDGAVHWATKQGSAFGQAGDHYCEAKWFVPDAANQYGGQYMYTGISDGPGVTDKYVLGGAVNKVTGTSDGSCSEVVEPSKVYAEYVIVEQESNKVNVLNHVPADADEPKPQMETNTCTGSTAAKAVAVNDNKAKTTSPVQDETTIQTSADEINILYTSSQAGSVKIVLVDVLGNAIVNNVFRCSTGINSYKISTNNWASGSYFVAIANGGYQFNKNILLIK